MRAVLQMFAHQGQGPRGLDVDLNDACTELLFQARDPGMHAVRKNSISGIRDGGVDVCTGRDYD